MAKNLNFEHIIHIFDEKELYEALSLVIKIMKSFDPTLIRNSVPIYIGLKIAKEHGIRTILTGDGADEIFCGYDWLFDLKNEQLNMELKKLTEVENFFSIPLAKELGIAPKTPYLEPQVKSFGLNIDADYKIRKENGYTYGKWILRKTFERILPKEIAWRIKTPIEIGAGTTILPDFFNQKISDEEFQKKQELYKYDDKVTICDKEQLFYYEIYRLLVGVPYLSAERGKVCPYCYSNILKKATSCRICGADLI